MSHYRLPPVRNEPLRDYAPGGPERAGLEAALADLCANMPYQVPVVINGERHFSPGSASLLGVQRVPAQHAQVACQYQQGTALLMREAIKGALRAKPAWEAMSFHDRAAIFMKAADLLSQKHRYRVMAATMLGQGKNVWQAEIDAAAELADFWRFNCVFAQDLIHGQQPTEHGLGSWNRVDYRALEGFLLAVTPFNFTAIGGNLPSAPALMGNVVIWKPSDSAILSNYLVYEILTEAGLPPGVIQFLPGPAAELCTAAIASEDFAGLHFTGSTAVFASLWQQIAANIPRYRAFPRIVGETGGKNLHFIHPSADLENAAHATVRAAFEFQGQKCSAASRLYCPESAWPRLRDLLVRDVEAITAIPVGSFGAFCGPVINAAAYEKITGYIRDALPACELVCGGTGDSSRGFFVPPTILRTTDPQSTTMREEIFGPVLTCFVYPDGQWEDWCRAAAAASLYGLTAAFFAQDRAAIVRGEELLRHAAGNFYINDKCTGATVGAQPFGGSRRSGTNDKAGSHLNLLRWCSPRTIKEAFVPLATPLYPSNQ